MTDDYRHCLITGAACWVATALALLLELENPYWATMTAWAMALPGERVPTRRALLQILATAAGCFFGYEIGMRVEGRPIMQLLAIFGVALGGTYLRFRSRFDFVWVLGAMSALMLLAFTLYSPEMLYAAARYRGYEIACGVAGVTIAQFAVGGLLRLEYPRGSASAPSPHALDRRDALEIALVGGFTVSIVPVIWYFFQLPFGSLLITMIAPLIALDAAFVEHPVRTHWRLVGAIVGGAFGVLAGAIAGDSFLLWSWALLGGTAACGYVSGGGRPWSAAGTMGGLAVVFSLVTGSGPTTDILTILNRIAGIVIGIGIMIGVAYAVRLVFRAQFPPAVAVVRAVH